MRLFVDQIKDRGLSLEGEEAVEDINRHFSRVMAEDVTFLKPLRYKLRARRVDELVELEGHLETACELACSRCLNLYAHALETEYSLAFAPAGHHKPDDISGDDLELDSNDLGLVLFSGDEIDLSESLYEQVVLALPQRPLCDEACSGLCPHCGSDLNQGECGCDPEPFNNKFSALSSLKSDKP